jgi:C4-dicarboxylate-specific signal transduction histidine kinase
VRSFADVPAAAVDKHKVLQIVVNLLCNAIYAMDEGGMGEKILTIRLRSHGAGMLAIEVSDTGVGIPEENLTRIFSHGFTTREEGHGFGLHSAALAAKDMGGSLRASSPGPTKAQPLRSCYLPHPLPAPRLRNKPPRSFTHDEFFAVAPHSYCRRQPGDP